MIVYPYINTFRKQGIHVIRYKDIQFLDLLGKGASSPVYQCLINGNHYCSKVFCSYDYISIDDMIELLTFEINTSNILSGLDHCNNFKGISYNQHKGKLYIYLLYGYILTTINIYKYLSTKWMPHSKNNLAIYQLDNTIKLSIIQQLIQGVINIHSKNIIHADLKLPNIVINNNNKITIIDYGSACIMDKRLYYNSEYDEFLGTDGYAAPELYNNILYYESDIYSLCVCIIEILIGNIWYDGNTYKLCRYEVLHAINRITNKKYKQILMKGINTNYMNRCTLLQLKNIFSY